MQDAIRTPSSLIPIDGCLFAETVLSHFKEDGVEKLLEFANRSETDWLEKKAGLYIWDKDPELKTTERHHLDAKLRHSIADAILAFRNSRGGVILVGIKPSPQNEVVSLRENDPKGFLGDSDHPDYDEYIRYALYDRIWPAKTPNGAWDSKTFDQVDARWTLIRQSAEDEPPFHVLPVHYRNETILAVLVPPRPMGSNPETIRKETRNKETRNAVVEIQVPRRRYGGKGEIDRTPLKDEGQRASYTAKRAEWLKKFDLSGELSRLGIGPLTLRDAPSTVASPIDGLFVGRDKELDKLHRLLSDGKIPVVTGPGGTGKTELALQYAARHKADYPGGLFQIDMEQAKSWDDAFRKLLGATLEDMHRLLGFSNREQDRDNERKGPSPKEIAGALARRAKEEGRILLVLDNVEDVGGFFGESIFERNAALSPDVRTIVTARKSSIQFETADRCVEFPLGDLPSEAALKLLLSSHPADSYTERQAAARITEELGGRPLYLCRIRALLKGKPRPFARSYVELEYKLRESECRLKTVGAAMEKTQDQDRTPEALWLLTREALSADEEFGAAWIKLAHIASFFSPDGFKKHVLRHLWGALAAPKANTDSAFEQALKVLRWHWLLSGDGEVLRMHRLNADALRQSAWKEDPKIEEKIGGKLAQYLGMAPEEWLTLAESIDVLAFVPNTATWTRTGRDNDGFSLPARLLGINQAYSRFCRWIDFRGMDWAVLLCSQPQFAEFCTWERLDGWDWTGLLVRWPQFAVRCLWEKLNGENWASLLKSQPQFAERCPWEKLDGENWASLLGSQPQFVERCPWEKLDGENWASLLGSQPQFAGRCPWGKLNGMHWASVLESQPQFAERCPWEKLDGWNWASLLESQPQFAERRPWEKLDGGDWASVLESQPQFADHCPWEKLNGENWTSLLGSRPQFAGRCPWEKLNGENWASLLGSRPQFAERCPWEKLDGRNWASLLESRPQFAERCPWEELNGEDWRRVLGKQPQLAERCPWEKLNGENWAGLFDELPQSVKWCPWERLNGENWVELLIRRPDFGNHHPWDKLDGRNWAELLGVQPMFAAHCSWKKLNGRDWAYLLAKRREFAERCPWEDLDIHAWAWLLRCQPQFIVRLRELASQGNAQAQVWLGNLCGNATEAAKWFREAAAQGNAEAQCRLGDIYRAGEGLERNLSEAISWYRRSSESGDARAPYVLASILFEQGKADEALPFAERAAKVTRKNNPIYWKIEALELLAEILDSIGNIERTKSVCQEALALFPEKVTPPCGKKLGFVLLPEAYPDPYGCELSPEERLGVVPTERLSIMRGTVLMRLGHACRTLGDIADARNAFQKALAIEEALCELVANDGISVKICRERAKKLRRLIKESGGV